jgi:serine/threonine protein kinase
MLVSDGQGGEHVKVLDFGIAKWAQKTTAQGGNIKTRTGVMIGTPTYMAPEQCGGEGEVCDRTDVYALGVMLFELSARGAAVDKRGRARAAGRRGERRSAAALSAATTA